MVKTFLELLDDCAGSIFTGTIKRRHDTKQAVIDRAKLQLVTIREHIKQASKEEAIAMVDAVLYAEFGVKTDYMGLIEKIIGPIPSFVNRQAAVMHNIEVVVDGDVTLKGKPTVVFLGEESGHTDGLPFVDAGAPAARWLPGDSKPTVVGVYPTKITLSDKGKPIEKEGHSYWTGEYWGIQRDRLEVVKTEGQIDPSAYQRKVWQNRREV